MKKIGLGMLCLIALLFLVGCNDDDAGSQAENGYEAGTDEDGRETGTDDETGNEDETGDDDDEAPAAFLEHTRVGTSMDAPIRISIFDIACDDDDEADERCALLDEAFELIFDLERRLTVNDVGGEVETVNEMAGIAPVVVEADTFYLIERSLYYSVSSDGLLNVAIGPLTRLWNISLDGARRPSDAEIEAVLPLLDPTRVALDAQASTVFLEEEGMRLDLGGTAKGFMADEVADLFTANGVERALIIIGGEVVAIGGRADGSPFMIGIHSPWASDPGADPIVGALPAHSQAVVTSGTYNRYLAHQETQEVYHHIFDSRTGFPFETDIVSISIVADTGLLGEIYTTIIFAMGIEEGLAYVETLPGIEALIISRDRGIYLTSGIQETFSLMTEEPFEIRSW